MTHRMVLIVAGAFAVLLTLGGICSLATSEANGLNVALTCLPVPVTLLGAWALGFLR